LSPFNDLFNKSLTTSRSASVKLDIVFPYSNRDLDAFVTHDPIGDAGYQELMDFDLSQLKKGGIYEASY